MAEEAPRVFPPMPKTIYCRWSPESEQDCEWISASTDPDGLIDKGDEAEGYEYKLVRAIKVTRKTSFLVKYKRSK